MPEARPKPRPEPQPALDRLTGTHRHLPQSESSEPQLPFSEERLGEPEVDAAELRSFGALGATRHLMALLARRRAEGVHRNDIMREAVELLYGLEDPHLVRRLLLGMEQAGRIIDIYPLELIELIVQERPGYLPQLTQQSLIRNKAELEAGRFSAGAVIALRVPLSAKLKSFALRGGGRPGYVFAPGPPAAYLLEIHSAGIYEFLLLAQVQRVRWLDKVRLDIGA